MKTKFLYAMVLASSMALAACGGSSSSSGGSGNGGSGDGIATPYDSEAGVIFAAMAAQGFIGRAGDAIEEFEEGAEVERSANLMVPRSGGVQCDSGSHHSETSSESFDMDGQTHSIDTEVDTYTQCVQELTDDDSGELLIRSTSNGRLEHGESSDGYFYMRVTGLDNDLSREYLTGKTENFMDVNIPDMPDMRGDSVTKSRLIQYGKESSNDVFYYSYADLKVDIPNFRYELKMGKNENEKLRLRSAINGGYDYLELDGYLSMKVNDGCLLAATYTTNEPLKIIVSNGDKDGDVVAGKITVEMDSGNVYNIEYKDGTPYVNGSIPTEQQIMDAAMAMSGCEA